MSQLLNMGGYELYVWGSVGLALAVFAWNVLAPALQRRALVERLAEGDAEDAS
ncbi:MAG: heme exporter protein CcmD [Panacagrimonas sp.]